MPSSDERFSTIAEILKRVVKWINQDRFEDHDSWMLFGNRSLLKFSSENEEWEELADFDRPGEEQVYEKMGDIATYPGKVLDARRTSLTAEPPKAPLPQLQVGRDWRGGREPLREPLPGEVAKLLDAYYASQIVGKLERIVERAASLDPHKVDVSQIHDNNMRAYFQQAHLCYLYGFSAACAVMCRAILEATLKAKLDPDGMIENTLPKGQKLFPTLIKKATLPDDLKAGVEQVKKCGDSAAHSMERFEKDYQSRGFVEESLAITREVLAHLYPGPSATEI